MSVNRILRIMRSKGYTVNERPYAVNLVAERNDTVRAESWDDTFHLFYRDSFGSWEYYQYRCTTDPSAYYIDNPVVPQGYGFIKKGQWKNAYKLGYHNGREALQQVRPITVIRNYDLKGIFKRYVGSEQTGIFGNNIHDRKGSMFNASAGCVVFADNSQFQELLSKCRTHRNLYGNSFSLTIIDFRDASKVRNNWIAAGLTAISLGGFVYAQRK